MNLYQFEENLMKNVQTAIKFSKKQYVPGIEDLRPLGLGRMTLVLNAADGNAPMSNVPCVNLDAYRDEIRAVKTHEEELDLIRKIIEELAEEMALAESMDGVLADYTQVKDRLVLQVVNYEKNKDALEHIPHRIIAEELALVVHAAVAKHEDGFSTTGIITNGHKEEWGVSLHQLFSDAMQSAPKLLPDRLIPLHESVYESFADELTDFPEARARQLMESFISGLTNDAPIYVLTNEYGSLGAASLFYPQQNMRISERLGCKKFYGMVLSTDVALVVPDDGSVAVDSVMRLLAGVIKELVADGAGALSSKVMHFSTATNGTILMFDHIYSCEEVCDGQGR